MLLRWLALPIHEVTSAFQIHKALRIAICSAGKMLKMLDGERTNDVRIVATFAEDRLHGLAENCITALAVGAGKDAGVTIILCGHVALAIASSMCRLVDGND